MSNRLEVACKPDRRIGAKPELVDYSVPLVIDVTEMYWVVPSWLVTVWAFRVWTSEIKITRGEGFHRNSGMAYLAVKSKG